MSKEKCPECGEEVERESVDIGIGVVYGPPACFNCGWSEVKPRVEDGYYHDALGGMMRVDAIIERAERFGLGEAAREAFKETENHDNLPRS